MHRQTQPSRVGHPRASARGGAQDDEGYLDALGKKRTAEVKRDARIGQADADRDAGIREAEARRQQMSAKYAADTQVADADRKFQLQKAAYEREVNTERAKAQLASELQQVRAHHRGQRGPPALLNLDRLEHTIWRSHGARSFHPTPSCWPPSPPHGPAPLQAKVQQEVKREELEILVVERQKQIEIEEQEIKRREKELEASVMRPADAARFRAETIAEGERCAAALCS